MDDSGFDSDPKQRHNQEDDRVFHASDSSSSSATTYHSAQLKVNRKQLHKKLERKIEHAKRLHSLKEKEKKNSSLIPIQRLPIPQGKVPALPVTFQREHHPLVEWESDDSDEDINFFPVARWRDGKQELTDTFSIEEFEVTPDDDDLDLLPPEPMRKRLTCCGLSWPKHYYCTIM